MRKLLDRPELGISVILPVYNESDNLKTLIPELSSVLGSLGRSLRY